MKKTNLLTIGVLMVAGSIAFAQTPPTPSPPPIPPTPPVAKLPKALLETFDKDKDGQLSDDEKNAMKAEMLAKMEARKAKVLEKYDLDKDGKLSDTEKATLKADMDARRLALIEKYDADKDGKLGVKEMQAARDAGEELPSPGMRPESRDQGLKKAPGPGPKAPAASE